MFCLQVNERLELRPVAPEHAAELFRLVDANHAHLRRWHPWADTLRSLADAEKLVATWQRQSEAGQSAAVGIWCEGRLCGMIHSQTVDWANRWTALSYWLDKAHQGQGIMTASCRAFIAYGFNTWKLNRITIECATDNARSRKIPERLGFQLEGIVRQIEWLHDHFADHAVYGLLRADFHAGAEISKQPKKSNAGESEVRAAFDLFNRGQTDAAEAACRELLPARPQDAQLLFLLGMVLHKNGRDAEAVRHLSQAAQIQPNSERIFQGLGCAHLKLKDFAQAVSAFERALSLNPRSNSTCYNLGNALFPLDKVTQAADAFQKAVEINPEDSGSWNNLGKCLKELNRIDESLAAYERALRLKPDYALARYGRAITLLIQGRYDEGFQDYEWREQLRNSREFNGPMWNGESIPSKTLFIHAEQGFGDAIQMVRFISRVRERVGTVILECRPELKTLFQRCVPADTIIAFGETIPAFDYFIPMASLPRALGLKTVDDLLTAPYLQIVARGSSPSTTNGPLKVGLAWAGNPNHHHDACRSLRLQDLAPILNVPGVSFYSLQQPVPERDAVYLRSVSDILRTHRPFHSFLDTAEYIAGLDLVITVDTAIAHLAGALGKPVWLLLQHSPDWRWQMDRADSPWYPATQLFRQTERGYWHPPVQRVAQTLQSEALARLGLSQIIPALENQAADLAAVTA